MACACARINTRYTLDLARSSKLSPREAPLETKRNRQQLPLARPNRPRVRSVSVGRLLNRTTLSLSRQTAWRFHLRLAATSWPQLERHASGMNHPMTPLPSARRLASCATHGAVSAKCTTRWPARSRQTQAAVDSVGCRKASVPSVRASPGGSRPSLMPLQASAIGRLVPACAGVFGRCGCFSAASAWVALPAF